MYIYIYIYIYICSLLGHGNRPGKGSAVAHLEAHGTAPAAQRKPSVQAYVQDLYYERPLLDSSTARTQRHKAKSNAYFAKLARHHAETVQHLQQESG